MILKRIAITFYAIVLVLFVFAIIITTFIDLFGTCTQPADGPITCVLWSTDVSIFRDTNNVIGYLANTNFFIFWILLGGCTLYINDWWKKRNA